VRASLYLSDVKQYTLSVRGRRVPDRMVVGFATTCTISAYHHQSCKFEPYSWRGVTDTTLCDKACQWLASTPVSSTNKTDHNDITEILLKVALNTVNKKNLLSLSLSVKSVYNWLLMVYRWINLDFLPHNKRLVSCN
jgi:hypothetical protein